MGSIDQFIMDVKEQELLLFDAEIEYYRYERIHTEFKQRGREYILKKYRNSNLTYIYRYLNSDAYENSKSTYEYVKNRLEELQRALELIAIFSPDLIDPRYYTNEQDEVFK